jgi:hypothetical protein
MFQRFDESPDGKFYAVPRFVTHIDDGAIAAVSLIVVLGEACEANSRGETM